MLPIRQRSNLWLISLALLLLLGYYAAYLAPLPFVEAWWNKAEWDDSYYRRHRIADWLVMYGSLVGLSRPEVVALLGEPPPTSYFDDWQLVYNLGAERGWLSIDSEWLVLRVDKDGMVSEVAIVRD